MTSPSITRFPPNRFNHSRGTPLHPVIADTRHDSTSPAPAAHEPTHHPPAPCIRTNGATAGAARGDVCREPPLGRSPTGLAQYQLKSQHGGRAAPGYLSNVCPAPASVNLSLSALFTCEAEPFDGRRAARALRLADSFPSARIWQVLTSAASIPEDIDLKDEIAFFKVCALSPLHVFARHR